MLKCVLVVTSSSCMRENQFASCIGECFIFGIVASLEFDNVT
jgi:hypothetical protein